MSSTTYTEDEVQDLTDRVFGFIDALQAGKMHFAAHLVDDFKRSLSAIRLRPDGKVDPTTVDGRIRSASLVIVAMRQREEQKAAMSLAQIQESYFGFLFQQFGWLYDQMTKTGANPYQAATVASREPELVKRVSDALPEMSDALSKFWKDVSDSAAYHLQDGQQLKATLGGDIFPAYTENAVSTAGLYVDTIVLPCPVTRVAALRGAVPANEVVRRLLQHTLTAMTYRDLAVVELDPPLVVVLPNPDDLDVERRKGLVERAKPAARKHAEYLFGRPFESLEELADFCQRLKTVDDVVAELRGGDRLLFDTDWERDARAQLSRTIAEGHPGPPGMDEAIAGNHVLGLCLGRMSQAKAAEGKALHFGGTPLINAETSWLHYTWLLEYEGAPAQDDLQERQTMHVVRALVSEAHNNLEWLGNVPPAAVLEIRKRGLAEEVRALLGRGVSNLVGINPNNYFRTADQVVENLEQAFREHGRALAEAKQKKLKLYGIDVAACLSVGGVAVAAALTASPTLGAISGLLGVAGLPNLREINTKLKQVVAEDRARSASPTGILFRHVRR